MASFKSLPTCLFPLRSIKNWLGTKQSFLKTAGLNSMKLCTKGINPLGFHRQGYKFEKLATLKEGRLSEETLLLSLTFFCPQGLASLIRKTSVHGTLKSCQNSSQRQTSRSAECVVPCIASLFLHVLTNFQASPARQTSLYSKDRLKNRPVLHITAGIELWKTFT